MSLAYPSRANGASLDHHTRNPVKLSCSSFEAGKRPNPGSPLRPVYPEACCERRELNGMNNQWPTPVIVDMQDTSCPSKNMRIFSFQRSCAAAGPERTPLRGLAGASQAWPGLHFMGSFKKLRSSVLQGIQNRGGVTGDNQEKDFSLTNEENNGFFVTKRNFRSIQANGKEMAAVSNGVSTSASGKCVLDEDDDDEEDGSGLQRNSHFSRSMRRAYGAGRISLLDYGRKQLDSSVAPEPSSRPRPSSTVESMGPEGIFDSDVKALSRLSKSADNLHVFKSPFKRKVSSTQTQNLEEPNTPNFERTASASSVVGQDCVAGRCRGVTGVRGKMLKLVGSLTDLSANRKPNPDPTLTAPLSALSQLHDDYSRRTPCVPAGERQRRPPPSLTCPSDRQKVQADVHSHTPAIHANSLEPVTIYSLNHQVPECSTSIEQVPSSYGQLPVSSPTCSDISVTPAMESGGAVKEEQDVNSDIIQSEQCTGPEPRLDSVKVNSEVRFYKTEPNSY